MNTGSRLFTDRDECTLGLHTCTASERCINEVGGYRCEAGGDDGGDLDDATEETEEDFTTVTPPVENSILGNLFTPTVPSRRNVSQRYSSYPGADSNTNAISKSPSCPPGYRDNGQTRPGERSSCVGKLIGAKGEGKN